METLNPVQVDNALTYLQEQWPTEPMSQGELEDYGIMLTHFYPGELVLALERLPAAPRPRPSELMEAVMEHRPVQKRPTNEFIGSVINQARRDLARAG